ncbi:hypothetical protein CL634_09175 [bacterium]|nr:hypothetical protein [bacterium]
MSDTPFKYTSKFQSSVKASCAEGSCKRWGISEASLENLRPLLPPEVDLSKNIDLLGVAFNGAVVNRFNKNGDGIDTATAIGIKNYFINKPTNIEHNKQNIVGHIISAAFSSFGENELITEEAVKGSEDPFNIALGALVYKVVNPAFARMLEQTGEGEEFENVVSASWEIGFNDYYIAVGSDDLSEAEVVTEKSQIKELSKYLKAYDGEGQMDDGTLVNRLVVGSIYPLGIGFTATPAADVKGVIVENEKRVEITPDEISEAPNLAGEKIDTCNCESYTTLKKGEKNSSLFETETVNKENALTMDTKDLLEKIEGMLSEKVGDSQHVEEAAASVSKVMMEAIRQKDEQWQAEKAAKEALLDEANKAQESLAGELEEVKLTLADTQSQLDELAEAKRLREAKDLFNQRMASVTEDFELEEEDLQIVASEISELSAEEGAFSDYQTKLTVMWSHKTKAHIEEQEKKFDEQLTQAVEERLAELSETKASEAQASENSVEEILDNAEEESTAAILNNNEEASAEEPSLREKFSQAFSKETVTVKY